MKQTHTSGSRILEEFRQAMEFRRAGGFTPHRRQFSAATSTRLTSGWPASDVALNSLLENALPVLVTRSRNWSRNSEYGKRFISQTRNGVVGPAGFTLTMRCGEWRQKQGQWQFMLDKVANDAIEAAWKKWCRRGVCDSTGKYSFFDVCNLAITHASRDGEALGRHVRGTNDNAFRYQLQLLNPDRLSVRTNADNVRMGVEIASTGKATHFHILQRNPNDTLSRGAMTAERVAAKDVLHVFMPLEVEQLRGVPWAHAVLLGANMLHAFEEAAVYAARTGASNMGFFTQNPPEGAGPVQMQDLGATEEGMEGELIDDMEPGRLQLLPRGVDFKPFLSKYPDEAFDPFTKSRKRAMASGLDVTYHGLTGDMEGVNYSSARIAELAERDHWSGVQKWFIESFVMPVFTNWLEMALLAGQITMPNGSALPAAKFEKFLEGAAFQPRGWDWVDPLKEVQAAKLAREEGLVTRTQAAAAKGGSFEDNVIEIAQEEALLAASGVKLGAAQAAPAQPADQSNKKPAAEPEKEDEK